MTTDIAIRKNNYCVLPDVRVLTKSGKTTISTIYYGLVSNSATKQTFKTALKDCGEGEIDETFTGLVSRIKPEYENGNIIMDDIKGFIIIRGGYEGGKISFKDPTFVTAGKNLGKANQTNIWTQTAADALSKHNKKNKPNEATDLPRPMLALGDAVSKDLLDTTIIKLYEKYKNNAIFQLKYDGHRMMCDFEKCYSRTAEIIYPSDQLNAELQIVKQHLHRALPEYAKDYKIYLDGEYYCHGKSLQAITSAVRYEQQSADKDELIYHVFDIPIFNKDGTVAPIPCINRIKALSAMNKYFQSFEFTKIIFVGSFLLKTPEAIKRRYLRALQENYEGLILRVADAFYEPGHNNYHSHNILKIKELMRDEFRLVAYSTGKGKAEGQVKFTCAIREENVLNAIKYFRQKGRIFEVDVNSAIGETFGVAPKLPADERVALYNKLVSGEINITDKLYTVEFRDWTDKLKPAQPVGIAFFE